MLIQSDAARIPLPDKSIHCVATSPPYWGLRKYSGDQTLGLFPDLGLEKTPEEHVERMVMIFREVRRVLRDDGVVWLNYGDCYGHGTKAGRPSGNTLGISDATSDAQNIDRHGGDAGNLMLMPHRVAIALQNDGWIVRNDLVWYKRNPMPESVAGWRWERERKRIGDDPRGNESDRQGRTLGQPPQRDHDGSDRFAQPEYEYGDDYVLRKGNWRHTRAHEYVFQLVKGPKMSYYSNQEAVREDIATSSLERINQETFHEQSGGPKDYKHGTNANRSVRGILENWEQSRSGRNPRSVLDVPTAPYKGAHYATFPPKLIAPLIRASCPRRSCPECGMAYAPVVKKQFNQSGPNRNNTSGGESDMEGWEGIPRGINQSNVLSYRPTCEHEGEPVAGIVLDPFAGSGTVGQVARELGRRWVLTDISRPYLDEQAKIRTRSGTPANALEGLPLFERLKTP